MITTDTIANLATTMQDIQDELYRTGGPELLLNGEIFLDKIADRLWFKVWNQEGDTTNWVAQVPERAAYGETLVVVDDTTEALMF